MMRWIPNRDAALTRLARFIPQAGHAYAKSRNYDFGPGNHNNVSTLSPWIRHRIILEQEVIAAVLAQHSAGEADAFIQEVMWRTYWKGWLELHPGVYSAYQRQILIWLDQLDIDAPLLARWRAATSGETGIDCFDSWCQELIETGYLHNHARMWFASIWVFTLKLPWELGADFFLRHLLDGDAAANTLSWRWVAGLQTQGEHYLAQAANIKQFTHGRFDPTGEIETQADPLVGETPPTPISLPDPVHWDANLPTALLLTDDDLFPESLQPRVSDMTHCIGVATAGLRSPLGVSPLVDAFTTDAVRSTLDRLRTTNNMQVEQAQQQTIKRRVAKWAQGHGVKQLVTAHPTVGPAAQLVNEVTTELAQHDINVVTIMREWDRTTWPYTTHGFFRFKKQIPMFLDELIDTTTSPL